MRTKEARGARTPGLRSFQGCRAIPYAAITTPVISHDTYLEQLGIEYPTVRTEDGQCRVRGVVF